MRTLDKLNSIEWWADAPHSGSRRSIREELGKSLRILKWFSEDICVPVVRETNDEDICVPVVRETNDEDICVPVVRETNVELGLGLGYYIVLGTQCLALRCTGLLCPAGKNRMVLIYQSLIRST